MDSHGSYMDWKTWKWENIFQSEISPGILNRLEKLGNFTQDNGKVREFLPVFMLFFSLSFS